MNKSKITRLHNHGVKIFGEDYRRLVHGARRARIPRTYRGKNAITEQELGLILEGINGSRRNRFSAAINAAIKAPVNERDALRVMVWRRAHSEPVVLMGYTPYLNARSFAPSMPIDLAECLSYHDCLRFAVELDRHDRTLGDTDQTDHWHRWLLSGPPAQRNNPPAVKLNIPQQPISIGYTLLWHPDGEGLFEKSAEALDIVSFWRIIESLRPTGEKPATRSQQHLRLLKGLNQLGGLSEKQRSVLCSIAGELAKADEALVLSVPGATRRRKLI